MGRYLVVLYWKGEKERDKGAGAGAAGVKEELERKRADIDRMKATFGVDGSSGSGSTET